MGRKSKEGWFMHRLLKGFLDEDRQNKQLFYKGVVGNDSKYLKEFRRKFYDYMFRLYFCSYVKKTIQYTAKGIRKKHLRLVEKEKLTLNVVEMDFDEEKVNIIADNSPDIVEQICASLDYMDYREIICSKDLILAVDGLTDKQKKIICKCIIEDKQEAEIARELGVSIQAVNKMKNAALKKLRKQLEVV